MRRRRATLGALTLLLAAGCTAGGEDDPDQVLTDWCERIEAAFEVGELFDDPEPSEDDLERYTELSRAALADPIPDPIEDDVVLLRGDGDLPDDGAEAMELVTEASSRISAFTEAECGVSVDDPPA
jgi:hypothetical protein